MIRAVINVDSPLPHVFQVFNDFPRYKDWIPGCERCTVTAQNGSITDTEIVINSMKRIELGLRFESVPPNALHFKMTRGKDIKAYSGTYLLMHATDGNGTVVIAELEIDAGFMVPKFMVDRMSRKMVEETGGALRKHIATLPVPTIAQGPVKKAAAVKPRRARRILRVAKTPAGYDVWLLGQTFNVKSQGS